MFELFDRLVELLQSTLDSPWLWAVVFLVAGLDALLPFMPSETTVVMVAVLLGSDLPQLALLAAVAAAGALAGDCLSHGMGRWLGPRAVARLTRGEKGRERYEWGRSMVARHATTLVVAARFLPGGRVASGLSTGSLGFPLRRFVALDAIGAGLWAVSSTAIGFVGGASFGDEPVKGLLLAFALALLVVGAIEAARRLRARRGGPDGTVAEAVAEAVAHSE
ncbi:DedA family protein [Streptomyces varsoviensis]|uniref:DedA family protein n=1 Tax=Streptomyces varsoviensis TaxID=67373 RepID=UPI00068AACE1|nr:VTT domain-containing protein [Streptomyces varsoviensis]